MSLEKRRILIKSFSYGCAIVGPLTGADPAFVDTSAPRPQNTEMSEMGTFH